MAHHDDVESVEAEDPREDSDEGAKEGIPTEEGKEIAREEDDEGEKVVLEHDQIAGMDCVSGNDESKMSEQDKVADESQQVGPDAVKEIATPKKMVDDDSPNGREQHAVASEEDVAKCEAAGKVEDATGSKLEGAEGEGALERTDTVEQSQRVGRKATSMPQGMHDNSVKRKRTRRLMSSHPVASPARANLGAYMKRLRPNAVADVADDSSIGRRSRSPRVGTEKQQERKAQPSKLNQATTDAAAEPATTSASAGLITPKRGRSAGSERPLTPAPLAIPPKRVCSEARGLPDQCGQPIPEKVSSGESGRILEKELELKKGMMNELVSKADFQGAAAALEDVKAIEALAEELRARENKMDDLVAKKNYLGAATVVEEIKKTEARIKEKFAPKNVSPEVAAAEAVAQDRKIHEEQLAAKKKMMDELVTKKDFNGAAAVQEEVRQLEDLLAVLVATAKPTGPTEVGSDRSQCVPVARFEELLQLEEQLSAAKVLLEELAAKRDFEGAATAQEEVKKMESLKEQMIAKNTMVNEPAAPGEQQRDVQKKMPNVPATEKEAAEAAAMLLADQLTAKKKMMDELALQRDFKGASIAQGEVKEIEALAASLRAKQNTMDELATKKDYAGAAAALDEIKQTVAKINENFGPKYLLKDAASAQAVALDIRTHEEQLAVKMKKMDELCKEKDFIGAAAVQEEVRELEKRLSVLVANANATGPARSTASDLLEEQIRSKTQKMNDLASKGDFVGAAAAKVELDDLTKNRSASTAVVPPLTVRVSGTHSDSRGGRITQRGAGSAPAPVSLEKMRVLSSSKITQVPARIPRKGSGKGKAAGKKGGGKKGAEPAWEDFAAIYLGCITTKQIYHILAFGDLVDKLRPYVELERQPIVNVKNLERRPGKEELLCTVDTVITTCLEPTEGEGSARFVYDVSQVTKHLATQDVGTKAPLGHFVDLVLRIDEVAELSIQTGPNFGEPYLQVTGVDMDGVSVGPLRLWNHVEGDLEVGSICILRGLKVGTERQWNGEKYVNDRDGAKKFDSDARTAIEDVRDQPEITCYFH